MSFGLHKKHELLALTNLVSCIKTKVSIRCKKLFIMVWKVRNESLCCSVKKGKLKKF